MIQERETCPYQRQAAALLAETRPGVCPVPDCAGATRPGRVLCERCLGRLPAWQREGLDRLRARACGMGSFRMPDNPEAVRLYRGAKIGALARVLRGRGKR